MLCGTLVVRAFGSVYHSAFVCLVQGFQALGDLPAFPHSHERLDTLTEFVTAQRDKLKNMCNKEKEELFIRSEGNVCKYGQFGFLNLIISLVSSVNFL